jgi:hypothetical protein
LLRHRKIAPIFAAAEARAVERTQVVVNRYAIDRARIMAELAAIGFSSLGDYLRPNADGDPVPSFADLTAQQMAAVAEVTIDICTEGKGDSARRVKRVRLKLHDKRAALVDLLRANGWATPLVPDEPDETPADRAARAAAIRAKLHAMMQAFAVPEPLVIEGRAEER